jgi:hypothetical protein
MERKLMNWPRTRRSLLSHVHRPESRRLLSGLNGSIASFSAHRKPGAGLVSSATL